MKGAGLAMLILLFAVSQSAAQSGIGGPVRMVRTLELLQDQIAEGAEASDAARRDLIAAIAQRFLAMDVSTWQDANNVNAALLYVLSGGNPAILDKLPEPDDEDREKLLAAVRAYATGAPSDAKALWAGIDLTRLPDELVGPAALVKANLLLDSDPAAAMRFVDIARLESPGTLIEEAAIRRGIEIAAKVRDAARFEFLSIRYATRFPHSMYAAAFRRHFAESYLAVASDDFEKQPELATVLSPLAADDRRDVYLEVARLAVLDTRMALARSAAEHAVALSSADTVPMMRAELYQAAAVAMLGDPQQASEALSTIKAKTMPTSDRELMQAVSSVVGAIQKWPAGAEEDKQTADAADDPFAGTDGEASAAYLGHVHDAIAAADQALSAMTPGSAQ